MMTSAQVVETSVTTTDNSPSQDYTHLDDQTTLLKENLLHISQNVGKQESSSNGQEEKSRERARAK